MKCFDDYRIRLVLVGFLAAIALCDGSAKADFTFGEPKVDQVFRLMVLLSISFQIAPVALEVTIYG